MRGAGRNYTHAPVGTDEIDNGWKELVLLGVGVKYDPERDDRSSQSYH